MHLLYVTKFEVESSDPEGGLNPFHRLLEHAAMWLGRGLDESIDAASLTSDGAATLSVAPDGAERRATWTAVSTSSAHAVLVGVRQHVLTQWATRTILSEQAQRALPEYLIGPDFLESFESLEGIKPEKVADVVVEIVTGRAPEIEGRKVHRLRSGSGGSDPYRVRDDGAVAWRASLQVNTASARRIHYWVLPDGRYELNNVAIHDDIGM